MASTGIAYTWYEVYDMNVYNTIAPNAVVMRATSHNIFRRQCWYS